MSFYFKPNFTITFYTFILIMVTIMLQMTQCGHTKPTIPRITLHTPITYILIVKYFITILCSIASIFIFSAIDAAFWTLFYNTIFYSLFEIFICLLTCLQMFLILLAIHFWMLFELTFEAPLS